MEEIKGKAELPEKRKPRSISFRFLVKEHGVPLTDTIREIIIPKGDDEHATFSGEDIFSDLPKGIIAKILYNDKLNVLGLINEDSTPWEAKEGGRKEYSEIKNKELIVLTVGTKVLIRKNRVKVEVVKIEY